MTKIQARNDKNSSKVVCHFEMIVCHFETVVCHFETVVCHSEFNSESTFERSLVNYNHGSSFST